MNAPASAMAPPSAQAPSAPEAVPARAATTDGLTKMPEPMMPPITISVTSASPSFRSSAGAAIRASYVTSWAGARAPHGARRSLSCEQHRSGHGARGADADKAATRSAPLHLVRQRGEDAPAGRRP